MAGLLRRFFGRREATPATPDSGRPSFTEPDWTGLPPTQRTFGQPTLTIQTAGFDSTLATHKRPLFLEPLGHHLSDAAPSGIADGLATLSPAPPTPMPPPLSARPTVQTFPAPSWRSSVVPSAPPEVKPVALSPDLRSLPTVSRVAAPSAPLTVAPPPVLPNWVLPPTLAHEPTVAPHEAPPGSDPPVSAPPVSPTSVEVAPVGPTSEGHLEPAEEPPTAPLVSETSPLLSIAVDDKVSGDAPVQSDGPITPPATPRLGLGPPIRPQAADAPGSTGPTSPRSVQRRSEPVKPPTTDNPAMPVAVQPSVAPADPPPVVTRPTLGMKAPSSQEPSVLAAPVQRSSAADSVPMPPPATDAKSVDQSSAPIVDKLPVDRAAVPPAPMDEALAPAEPRIAPASVPAVPLLTSRPLAPVLSPNRKPVPPVQRATENVVVQRKREKVKEIPPDVAARIQFRKGARTNMVEVSPGEYEVWGPEAPPDWQSRVLPLGQWDVQARANAEEAKALEKKQAEVNAKDEQAALAPRTPAERKQEDKTEQKSTPPPLPPPASPTAAPIAPPALEAPSPLAGESPARTEPASDSWTPSVPESPTPATSGLFGESDSSPAGLTSSLPELPLASRPAEAAEDIGSGFWGGGESVSGAFSQAHGVVPELGGGGLSGLGSAFSSLGGAVSTLQSGPSAASLMSGAMGAAGGVAGLVSHASSAGPTAEGTSTPAPAPAPGGAGAGGDLDDLARRLYDRIRDQLKRELRLDRERHGMLTDIGG